MSRIVTIVAICLLVCVSASAQKTADSPLLIGRVAVNQTHIAFTYAGKIWLVERTGGTAKRLTRTICVFASSGEMGVLVVRQEGEKLFALPPGGERIELVPDTTADKFSAQPVGGTVTFERGPEGKVTAIVVTLPNGRVVKARKT